MNKLNVFFYCLMLGAHGLLPLHAGAEDRALSPAAQAIKTTIEQIREEMKSERGKIPELELNKKLEKIIGPLFDFTEMSRSCIGNNWDSGTPAQQQEFIDLFTRLLSHTYIEKIKKVEHNEVKYIGDQVKGDRAAVKTLAIDPSGEEVHLNYRLRNIQGTWRIYDVIIENVGLVTNYRSEFTGIVRKKQFSGLLEDLRQKKLDQDKVT